MLPGFLAVPQRPVGAVVFAHGSGSGRLSPRNAAVAGVLNLGGFATLLFDLLTERESTDRANVFDIELLAARLGAGVRWVRQHRATIGLPVGLFGASTGGAAALVVAAEDHTIGAVVSRGGRPDLAVGALAGVRAPSLLIVGAEDHGVIELNQGALRLLAGPKRLVLIPGATHLFEEPGALERVASLASGWFAEHLPNAAIAAESRGP
jgi:putative phosphoribosyl transferase